MAEQIDKLGLDASDYINEVSNIERALDSYNQHVDATVKALNNLGVSFGKQTAKISEMAGVSSQFVTKLKQVGGQIQVISSDIKNVPLQVVTEKLSKYNRQIVETTESVNDLIRAQIREENQRRRSVLENIQRNPIRNRIETGTNPANVPFVGVADQARQKAALEALEQQIDSAAKAVERQGRISQQAVDSQKQAQKKLVDATKNTSEQLVLSWRLVVRIFQFNVLYSALGALSSALGEATRTATTFSIRIAEIQTISQDAARSTEFWSSAVRRLSDEFGNPILDVAEGLYETISNQIGQGADAINFMNEALKFSQTTVSSAEDSVNLLSSAINGFRLSTQDTTYIASVFFETINVGRVRAQEMANTFGRVAPLAANLGVTFEELNAAIATLTIQGVTPSETLTAINGVMTKLYRPTEAMQKLFKSWGVESGGAAIATFGFAGAIQKMFEAAANGEAEMSELFNEIRATRGITGLTRAFDDFETTIDRVSNASQAYANSQAIVVQSVGKQFEIQFNQLRNFFSEDFGAKFIAGVVDVIKYLSPEYGLVGIVKEVVSVTKVLGASFIIATLLTKGKALAVSGLTTQFNSANIAQRINAIQTIRLNRLTNEANIGTAGAALALSRYTAQTKVATAANVLLARSANLVTSSLKAFAPFLLISAAVYAYEQISRSEQEVADQFKKNNDERADLVKKMTEGEVAEYARRSQAFGRALQKQNAEYGQYVASLNRLGNQFGERQVQVLKDISEALGTSFGTQLDAVRSLISDLDRQISTARSNIESANASIERIKDDLVRGRFDAQLKILPEDQRITAITGRIEEMKASALKLLAAPAKDSLELQKNLQRATQMFEESQRQANEVYARRAEAEKKLVELTKERQELEARIGSNSEISGTKDRLAELRNLEAAESEAARRKDSRRLSGIREEKRQVQELLRVQNRDAGSNRDAERLAELNEQIALQEKIKSQIPEMTAFQNALAESANKYTEALKEHQRLNDEAAAKAQKQREEEAARLKDLQNIFQKIGEFKVGGDIKITTKEQVEKSLQEYDDLVSKARKANGLKDLKDYALVQQKRAELERDLNARINQERINQDNERITKEIENAKKLEKESRQQQITTKDLVNTNSTALQQNLATLRGFLDTFAWGGAEGVNTEEQMDQLKELTQSLKQNPTKENLKELQKAINDLTVSFGRFGDDPILDALIPDWMRLGGRSQADPRKEIGGVSLSRVLSDIEIAARNFVKATEDNRKANEDRAGAEKEFERLGLTARDFKAEEEQVKVQRDFTKETKASVDNLLLFKDNVAKASNQLSSLVVSQNSSLADVAKALKEGLTNVANAITSGQPAQGKALGGPVWRSGGRFVPRGTDTVPAMLTPGEFVVKASVAKKWAATLNAMNSGSLYAASGGFVPSVHVANGRSSAPSFDSSVHVGDIHVHGAGNDGKTSVLEIARAIRREVRLGRLRD